MGTYTVNLHVPLGVYTIFPVVWNYGNFDSHDCWQQLLLPRICENAKECWHAQVLSITVAFESLLADFSVIIWNKKHFSGAKCYLQRARSWILIEITKKEKKKKNAISKK